MQKCAFLSGGARRIFFSQLPSTIFICVCSEAIMGPTCVRAANALEILFAQDCLSCRFSHINWHAFQIVSMNSYLKWRISYEHFSCDPILEGLISKYLLHLLL